MNNLLEMNNIEKYYGASKAVDGVSLEVKQGEVHALLGANGAGKSTLMKVLFGEIPFNGGEIIFDGSRFVPGMKWKASDIGISMVHQELSAIPELTVAQYMFLGREIKNGIFVDDVAMEKLAGEYLARVGAEILPTDYVGLLSVAELQLLEIAKALTFHIKLLVMDEPTTALDDVETESLFKIIADLKEQGISIIYISHRLSEIIRIADRITVMKDGKYVKSLEGENTSEDELVRLLAGREIISVRKETNESLKNAETVLEVRNLSTKTKLSGVSFSLKKGEILGLAGLVGSGRTETARAVCGIDSKLSGTVFINGKQVKINSPKDAARYGICYLSEDRNLEGMIQNRSIIGNSVISSLHKYKKGMWLDDKQMLTDTVDYNARVKTKYSGPHAEITSLSGGNCQKVIVSRWLIRNLPILIFDEPTKGIDVGAKDEIFQIIKDIVSNGHSVILISSIMDELLENCDRIIVTNEGKVSGELDISEASNEKIMGIITGRDE